ncbi:unnamed protein product [Meganyctiphanes norvegica]|uniref:Uncharacterized protein n=1 Tax=Meganyctiphanes norvegica TaxID=48144 RepID=A0AAV2QE48_MEGNR
MATKLDWGIITIFVLEILWYCLDRLWTLFSHHYAVQMPKFEIALKDTVSLPKDLSVDDPIAEDELTEVIDEARQSLQIDTTAVQSTYDEVNEQDEIKNENILINDDLLSPVIKENEFTFPSSTKKKVNENLRASDKEEFFDDNEIAPEKRRKYSNSISRLKIFNTTCQEMDVNTHGEILEDHTNDTMSNDKPLEEVVTSPVDVFAVLEWTIDHQVELSIQNKIAEKSNLDNINSNIAIPQIKLPEDIPISPIDLETNKANFELSTSDGNKDKNMLHEYPISESDSTKKSKYKKKRNNMRRKTTSINLSDILAQQLVSDDDSCAPANDDNCSVSSSENTMAANEVIKGKEELIEIISCQLLQLVPTDKDYNEENAYNMNQDTLAEGELLKYLNENNETNPNHLFNIQEATGIPDSQVTESTQYTDVIPQINLPVDIAINQTDLDTEKDSLELSTSDGNNDTNMLHEYSIFESNSIKKSKNKKKRNNLRRKTTSINLSDIIAQKLVTDDDDSVILNDVDCSVSSLENTMAATEVIKNKEDILEIINCQLSQLVPTDKENADNVIQDTLAEGDSLQYFNENNKTMHNHSINVQEATGIYETPVSESTQSSAVEIIFTLEKVQPLEDTTERLEAMMTLHDTDLSQKNRVTVEDINKNLNLKTDGQDNTEILNQTYFGNTVENISKGIDLKASDFIVTENETQSYPGDTLEANSKKKILETGEQLDTQIKKQTSCDNSNGKDISLEEELINQKYDNLVIKDTDTNYNRSVDQVDEEKFKVSEEKLSESFDDNNIDWQSKTKTFRLSCLSEMSTMDKYEDSYTFEDYSINDTSLVQENRVAVEDIIKNMTLKTDGQNDTENLNETYICKTVENISKSMDFKTGDYVYAENVTQAYPDDTLEVNTNNVALETSEQLDTESLKLMNQKDIILDAIVPDMNYNCPADPVEEEKIEVSEEKLLESYIISNDDFQMKNKTLELSCLSDQISTIDKYEDSYTFEDYSINDTDLSQGNQVTVEDITKNMSLKTDGQDDIENLNQTFLSNTIEKISKNMCLKAGDYVDAEHMIQAYIEIDTNNMAFETDEQLETESLNQTHCGNSHGKDISLEGQLIKQNDKILDIIVPDINYNCPAAPIDKEKLEASEEKWTESHNESKDDLQTKDKTFKLSCFSTQMSTMDKYEDSYSFDDYSINEIKSKDNSKIIQYISSIVNESLFAAIEQIMLSNNRSNSLVDGINLHSNLNLVLCNASEELCEDEILPDVIVDRKEFNDYVTKKTDKLSLRETEMKISDENSTIYENLITNLEIDDEEDTIKQEEKIDQYISPIVEDINYSLLQSTNVTELSKLRNCRDNIKELNMESINKDSKNREDIEVSDNWAMIDILCSEDVQNEPNKVCIIPRTDENPRLSFPTSIKTNNNHDGMVQKNEDNDTLPSPQESNFANIIKKEDINHLNQLTEDSGCIITDETSSNQTQHIFDTELSCTTNESINKDLSFASNDLNCISDNSSICEVVDSEDHDNLNEDVFDCNLIHTNNPSIILNEKSHQSNAIHHQIVTDDMYTCTDENAGENLDYLNTSSSLHTDATDQKSILDTDNIIISMKQDSSDVEYIDMFDPSSLNICKTNKNQNVPDTNVVSIGSSFNNSNTSSESDTLSHRQTTNEVSPEYIHSSSDLEDTKYAIKKSIKEQSVEQKFISSTDFIDLNLDMNNAQNTDNNFVLENNEDNTNISFSENVFNSTDPTIQNESMLNDENKDGFQQITSKENHLSNVGTIKSSYNVDIAEQPKLVSDTMAILAHLDQLNHYLSISDTEDDISFEENQVKSNNSDIPSCNGEILNEKYPKTQSESSLIIKEVQSADNSINIFCDPTSEQEAAQSLLPKTCLENPNTKSKNSLVIQEVQSVDDSLSIFCYPTSEQDDAQSLLPKTCPENQCISNTNMIKDKETDHFEAQKINMCIPCEQPQNENLLNSDNIHFIENPSYEEFSIPIEQSCRQFSNDEQGNDSLIEQGDREAVSQCCDQFSILTDIKDNKEQFSILEKLKVNSETKVTEGSLIHKDYPHCLSNPPDVENISQFTKIPKDNKEDILYTNSFQQMLEHKNYTEPLSSQKNQVQPGSATHSEENQLETSIKSTNLTECKISTIPEMSQQPQNTTAVVSTMAPLVGMLLPRCTSQELEDHITHQQSLETPLPSETAVTQSLLSQVAASGAEVLEPMHNVISSEDAAQGIVSLIGSILMESFNF